MTNENFYYCEACGKSTFHIPYCEECAPIDGTQPTDVQQTNGGEDAQICPDCGDIIRVFYHKETAYRNCGCVEW